MRRSTKKSLAAATAAFVLAATAAAWTWAVPAYVREKAGEAAERKGLHIRAGEVRVSWRRAEIRDVEVTSTWFPGQRAVLDSVTVRTSSTMSVERVTVEGGTITASGTAGELRGMLKTWRASISPGGAGGKDGPGMEKEVRGIRVRWDGALGPGSRLEADGVAAENGSVKADRIRIEAGKSWIETSGVTVAKGIRVEDVKASVRTQDAKLARSAIQSEQKDEGSTREGSAEEAGGSVTAEVGTADLTVNGTALTATKARVEAGPDKGGLTVVARAESVGLEKVGASGVRVEVRAKKHGDGLILDGEVSARTLSTRAGKVAKGEIRTRRIGIRGKANVSRASASVEAEAFIGEAKTAVGGEWGRGKSVALDAEMGPTDCQELLESMPESVVRKLMPGTRMSGSLSWRIQVEVDLPDRKKPSVRLKLRNGCKVEEVPERMRADSLLHPFNLEVYGPNKERRTLRTGPGTKDWVPLQLMSRFVPLAFRTMEDPGFMAHRGFHVEAIENSMKMNITEGRFIRGASTISMQLAKNLWLSRDKTVARKVQEAILTTYLEQQLSKDRILETYLNVIEFGPGLYGIGPAAERYFGTSPTVLSLSQSLFLASLLPNPAKNGYAFGAKVHPAKMALLHRIMKAMRDRQLISDDEYEEGIREVLTYGRASTESANPEPIETAPDGLDPAGWAGTD